MESFPIQALNHNQVQGYYKNNVKADHSPLNKKHPCTMCKFKRREVGMNVGTKMQWLVKNVIKEVQNMASNRFKCLPIFYWFPCCPCRSTNHSNYNYFWGIFPLNNVIILIRVFTPSYSLQFHFFYFVISIARHTRTWAIGTIIISWLKRNSASAASTTVHFISPIVLFESISCWSLLYV